MCALQCLYCLADKGFQQTQIPGQGKTTGVAEESASILQASTRNVSLAQQGYHLLHREYVGLLVQFVVSLFHNFTEGYQSRTKEHQPLALNQFEIDVCLQGNSGHDKVLRSVINIFAIWKILS